MSFAEMKRDAATHEPNATWLQDITAYYMLSIQITDTHIHI